MKFATKETSGKILRKGIKTRKKDFGVTDGCSFTSYDTLCEISYCTSTNTILLKTKKGFINYFNLCFTPATLFVFIVLGNHLISSMAKCRGGGGRERKKECSMLLSKKKMKIREVSKEFFHLIVGK